MNEMFQNFTFSFDSSDGRAGDCSCEKAIIPRSLVRIRFEGAVYLVSSDEYDL